MGLTREQIATVQDVDVRKVDVPEWGGEVFIKTITAAERDRFESSVNDGENRNLANMRARLVVLCLCDEGGALLFDDSGEGANAIGQKNAEVVDRLFDVARKINGMTAEDVKELEGN